jgi:hypothetical protein
MDKSKLSEMIARNKKEPEKEKRKWIDENLAIDGASYPYAKQREIVINELAKGNEGEIVMPLNGFRDQGVDVLKTLLALEKENILRIKELQSNVIFDNNGKFIGLWATKDNPTAKIQILNVLAVDAAKRGTRIGRDAPFTSEVKGKGYFHFNKHTKKILIGAISGRPFRLLRRLCDPFGLSQNVEEVFGFIRLPKDDRDPLLREFVPEKRSRMVHIIKVSCNKELQKKMGGKMKFCFDPQETRIWLELIV